MEMSLEVAIKTEICGTNVTYRRSFYCTQFYFEVGDFSSYLPEIFAIEFLKQIRWNLVGSICKLVA